jgi:hypothetical protein
VHFFVADTRITSQSSRSLAFILAALGSVNQALNNVRPLSTNGFELRLTVAAHFGEYELSIGNERAELI